MHLAIVFVAGYRCMDTLTPSERSARMALIRSANTKPEVAVRRLAHAMGYRFRLHRRDLPGRPDIVFPGRRKVILVHGCFWHAHADCKVANQPKSRSEFWREKFARNKSRDAANLIELARMKWDVLVVWECETKNIDDLRQRLRAFLE